MPTGTIGRIICGVIVTLLGSTVLIGWTLQIPVLVQMIPGFVAMVINTAVCFVISGIAILLPLLLPTAAVRLNIFLGGAILTIACMGLAANLNLIGNIDWPALHNWLADGNPNPGRMAPNTALGFLFAGAAIILGPLTNGQRQTVIIVRLLTIGILLIGTSGIIGYFLHLNFLYSWYNITRMALHTAAGIIILAIGIWLSWSKIDWHQLDEEVAEHRKILSTAGFILSLVALTAGLSGFIILQNRMEEQIGQNLGRMQQDRVLFFANTVEHRIERAVIVSTRPSLIQAIHSLEKNPGDKTTVDEGEKSMRVLLSRGFSAITISNLNNKKLMSIGKFVQHPSLIIPLANREHTQLLWNNGYMLKIKLPIQDQQQVIGYMDAELVIPPLTDMAKSVANWGETGEVGICGLKGTQMICFPQRLRPEVFVIPRIINNQPLPMSLALDGNKGITITHDYRGKNVIAAYGLIGDLGLGMVLKMDIAEVYQPIREQFQLVIPALILVVAIGIWLLRAQVGPLVKWAHDTRRMAQKNEARFRAATESSIDAFYILESERNREGDLIDFRFTYLNGPGEKNIAFSRDEALGKQLCKLLPAYCINGLFEKYKHVANTGEACIEELQINAAGAPPVWIYHQIVRLGDGIAITSRDVTEKKLNEAQLVHKAENDPLTGLPNRALFNSRLEQAIARNKRNEKMMAVMYMDIDHFNTVNDSLGHAAGDALLIGFAQRLIKTLRASDTIARIGGDEFTVIAEGLNNETDAEKIASSIRRAIQPAFGVEGHLLNISASIGIACLDSTQTMTASELLRRADTALYNVKSRGRDGYEVYASAVTA